MIKKGWPLHATFLLLFYDSKFSEASNPSSFFLVSQLIVNIFCYSPFVKLKMRCF